MLGSPGYGHTAGRLAGPCRYAPGMDVNGTAAIVSGGASGLGEATARALAAAGATVVIADLNDDGGKRVAS